MTSTRIYAPDGLPGRAGTDLARLPASLAGQRVIALDNGKPGATTLLTLLAGQLATRTGASFVGIVQKGSAATPCEEPLLERIIDSADLVLTGTAD